MDIQSRVCEVPKCYWCIHAVTKTQHMQFEIFCSHEHVIGSDQSPREIPDVDEIPVWCPLPTFLDLLLGAAKKIFEGI